VSPSSARFRAGTRDDPPRGLEPTSERSRMDLLSRAAQASTWRGNRKVITWSSGIGRLTGASRHRLGSASWMSAGQRSYRFDGEAGPAFPYRGQKAMARPMFWLIFGLGAGELGAVSGMLSDGSVFSRWPGAPSADSPRPLRGLAAGGSVRCPAIRA